MNGLLTDLYQLTMAAGYWQAGKTQEVATFELLLRHLPPNRNFILAAGLQQAVDYLLHLRFTAEEIEYLRGLPQFARAGAGFFDTLRDFRFTGDLWAVPEGTPMFAGEPLAVVRAPLLEAQIPETYLLATIGFQTLVATKAARIVNSAAGRAVVEFGTRRAHSPEAGVLAARASYIGGCAGTSNTLAGMRYGIPVFGTAAHSWVLSFESERKSYEELQRLLGPATIYLIDSYDTLQGARTAAALGRPLWGVRLDSGNLVELSRQVRKILDGAGLKDARIMATGDLNEYKILELDRAPIDAFGVGTELATSCDAPSHGAIYKMVELNTAAGPRYTAKFSPEKMTMPGAKQVYRYSEHDLLTRHTEAAPGEPEPLLRPVILNGQLVEPLPAASAARERARVALERLPTNLHSLFTCDPPWHVEYSAGLNQLLQAALKEQRGTAS